MVLAYLRGVTKRVSRRLLPGGSVVESTVKSGVWAGMTTILGQGFEFLRLLVLAVLLSPTDFGLMGIALLSLSALRKFTELGINDALIQNPDEDVNRYLDTAWVMNVARGLVLFTGLFLTAPYLANFFGEQRATDLVRVVGLVPLLVGLQNPAVVYFVKDLKFHKRFLQEVSGAAAGAAVAIVYALVYASVWALVAGVLAREITRIVVSYAIDGYRPSPTFDVGLARELLGYGKWITGLSILVFLNNSGDDIFVGWFLTATALGFYQFAYQLSNLPATQVSHVISSVAFPAYSKVQNDIAKLREGYLRVLKLVTIVSMPMAVGIALTAEPFIRGFLGEKWLPAVVVIQILAAWGLLRSLGATSSPLFKAIGRPDYSTKLAFLKMVIIAIAIYPATKEFGIAGTAAVIVLNSLLFAQPIVYYLVMKTTGATVNQLLQVFVYPIAATVVMGACIWFVRESVPLPLGSFKLQFAMLVVVGVLVYSSLLLVLERRFDYGLEPIVRTVVTSLR